MTPASFRLIYFDVQTELADLANNAGAEIETGWNVEYLSRRNH